MSWNRVASVLATFAVACGFAFAQTTGATLVGTLNDPSGLAVPNLTVDLKSAATNALRTVTTTNEGIFRFNALEPGVYDLTVRPGAGFQQYVVNQITLNVSETRDLGRLRLSLGSVTESVSVTAATTPVQTASSENSNVVDFDQMANLTVRGRDVMSMLQTLPGVSFGNNFITQGGSGQSNNETVNPFALGQMNLNGKGSAANYTVDGVTGMDMAGDGLSTVSPNLEAIAEVRVLATNYSAEFGRDLGGQLQVITKGGTSQFHGSANVNKRHEEFNANSFFNNRDGQTKPFYRFLDTAFSIGGPVYIPKIMTRTRNKVFFFFSQDYLGQRSNPSTGYASVPTANERKGDFSYLPDSKGNFVSNSLRNPITGQLFTPWNGNGTYNGSQNFAQYLGNFDAKSEAYGAAMLAAIPLPNLCNADAGTSDGKPWNGIAAGAGGSNLISPGNCPSFITSTGISTGLATGNIDLQGGPGTNNNYTRNFAWIFNGPIKRRNDDARLDFQPTQKLHAFVHFGHDYFLDSSAGSIPLLNAKTGKFESTSTHHPLPGQIWAIDFTYIVSPTIVNQLTLGYSWNDYGYDFNPDQLSPANLNNPPSFHNFAKDPLYNQPPTSRPETTDGQRYYAAGFPSASFGGGSNSEQGLGQPFCNGTCPNYNFNPTYQIAESVSKTWRAHNIKVGIQYEWNRKTETAGNSPQGSYSFNGSVSDTYFANNTGDGYANALLGNISSYTEGQRWLGLKTSKSLDAFVQDSWRVSKRLNLDIGLRFDHMPAMQDASGNTAEFVPSTYNPALAERIFYPYCSVSTATTSCSAANTYAWDPATNPNANIGTGLGGPGNMYPGYIKPGTLIPLNVALAGGVTVASGGYGVAPNPYTGMQAATDNNPALPLQHGVYQVPKIGVAPRFGFAWDVFGNGRTAVRGGIGVNLRREPNSFLNGQVGAAPIGQTLTQNYGTIASVATNPLAGYIQSALPNPNQITGVSPYTTTSYVGRYPYEASYNGSFEIQQNIGFSTVLQAAYVFVDTRHSTMSLPGNLPTSVGGVKSGNSLLFGQYQPASLDPTKAYLDQYLPGNASGRNLSDNYFRTDYRGYGQVSYGCFCGSSDVNSLQVSARRNLTHRFSLTVAYTWLKTMSLQGGRSNVFADKDRNWGPSYSPTPMYASVTYTYQVPNVSRKLGFRPLGWVTDNWQLDGVTQLRGNIVVGVPGFSFTTTNSTNLVTPNYTGTAGEGARVNIVGDWRLPSDQVSFVGGPTTSNIGVNGTPGNALINMAAFAAPNPCSLTPNANPRVGIGENLSCFGNAGAGSLITIPGTHLNNWDMTFRKRFPIKGEKRFFEFRAEMYNIFNHTQFLGANISQTYDWGTYKSNGSLVPTNGNAGRYTSAAGPRIMSFALRFQF